MAKWKIFGSTRQLRPRQLQWHLPRPICPDFHRSHRVARTTLRQGMQSITSIANPIRLSWSARCAHWLLLPRLLLQLQPAVRGLHHLDLHIRSRRRKRLARTSPRTSTQKQCLISAQSCPLPTLARMKSSTFIYHLFLHYFRRQLANLTGKRLPGRVERSFFYLGRDLDPIDVDVRMVVSSRIHVEHCLVFADIAIAKRSSPTGITALNIRPVPTPGERFGQAPLWQAQRQSESTANTGTIRFEARITPSVYRPDYNDHQSRSVPDYRPSRRPTLRFVGDERFAGYIAGQTRTTLFALADLYTNFFQPPFKLLAKALRGQDA